MRKLLLFLFVPFLMNGQHDILGLTSRAYNPTSNITNLNEKSNVLDIGVSYEFKNKQAQIIYNFTNRHFVFGSYNENNSTSTYRTLFGGERKTDILNSGFSIGIGIQKIAKIRGFKNTELLFGFEFQKFATKDYFSTYPPEEKDILNQNYYKIFAQFNLTRCRENFDFGYSLKLSYFKITSYTILESGLYKSNLTNDFSGKSTFMLDPTLNFNFKILKSKDLLFTSQIGFSSALWTISDYKSLSNESGIIVSSKETQFYFSPILKFGIQYRINFNK